MNAIEFLLRSALIVVCFPLIAEEAYTLPEVVSKAQPIYPEDLKSAGVQGTVVLVFDVGDDGRPQNFEVIQSPDPRLDRSAMEAIRQWRFRPGTEAGHVVNWKYTRVEVTFRAKGVEITGAYTPLAPPRRRIR